MTALNSAAPAPSALGRPIALFVEPSVGVSASVAGLLAPHGFEISIAKGVPDDLDSAAFVLVEADRGARAVSLIKRIHALRPELPIAGVLPWWDDDERDIADIARFVLHVPLRDDQLEGFARFAASTAAGA